MYQCWLHQKKARTIIKKLRIKLLWFQDTTLQQDECNINGTKGAKPEANEQEIGGESPQSVNIVQETSGMGLYHGVWGTSMLGMLDRGWGTMLKI